MPVDHIRYDILVQEALRGMVRDVLAEAAKNKGMPGEHHFFITFDTTAEDVRLSERLRAQYPEEMTIVLQHQFWDLKVSDEGFEVGLSFGGVAGAAGGAVRRDQGFRRSLRSVHAAIRDARGSAGRGPDEAEADADKQPKAKRRTPAAARSQTAPAFRRARSRLPQHRDKPRRPKPGDKAGAEVVRLDRFRKK